MILSTVLATMDRRIPIKAPTPKRIQAIAKPVETHGVCTLYDNGCAIYREEDFEVVLDLAKCLAELPDDCQREYFQRRPWFLAAILWGNERVFDLKRNDHFSHTFTPGPDWHSNYDPENTFFLKELMKDALGALAPSIRETVVLRYCDGLSIEQVSNELCIPIHKVHSRLRRAQNVFDTIVQKNVK